MLKIITIKRGSLFQQILNMGEAAKAGNKSEAMGAGPRVGGRRGRARRGSQEQEEEGEQPPLPTPSRSTAASTSKANSMIARLESKRP